MHDWKFDKVYDKPDDEVEKIKQYYAALTPDFSLFTDMPLALQIVYQKVMSLLRCKVGSTKNRSRNEPDRCKS